MRIAVFCGSSSRSAAPYLEAARELGAQIARRGHVLVYGGGRTGLMGAVADGALAHGGVVRGVILRAFIESDVHHRGLAELAEVDDMRARKAGLDRGADAFVALPGGLGTLEELAEILSFRKLRLHARPLVFVNTRGFYDPLLAQLDAAVTAGFDRPRIREFYAVVEEPREAVSRCESDAASG